MSSAGAEPVQIGVDGALNALAVLVVDDEPDVAEELADGLMLRGFRARHVNSADEAAALLRERQDFGVVITDIRMPHGDGLALARKLLVDRAEVPFRPEVILVTGHATIEDAEEAIRAGVSDFLRKPFRLEAATRAVRAALSRAEGRRQAASDRDAQLNRLKEERDQLIANVRELSGRLQNVAAPAAAREDIERDLAAISHALRTPLNAISGGAMLLGTKQTRADPAWCLEVVRQGVADAVKAVELLEELHRLDGGDREPSSPPAEVRDVVQAAVARIKPTAVEAGVNVSWWWSPVGSSAEKISGRAARVLELCGLALLSGVGRDWTISIGPTQELAPLPGVSFTVIALPPGHSVTAAEVPLQPGSDSHLSSSHETLALAVARRIASQLNGTIASFAGPDGIAALQVAFRRV